MNLHPEMARQLAADRQDELRLRADRARLGSTERGGLGRSRPVARLVGWWRQDAAAAPAHPDHTARAGPVIDLTEGGELMITLQNVHEPIDALELEAAARRY